MAANEINIPTTLKSIFILLVSKLFSSSSVLLKVLGLR
jgi:hypothetical protein